MIRFQGQDSFVGDGVIFKLIVISGGSQNFY